MQKQAFGYTTKLKCLALLVPSILVFSTAFGQTTLPTISLNSTMHTSRINRISVDAASKQILTCSDDKTAKLWDAQTGNLLKTFNVPIDKGSEGELLAAAISPDGKTALLGGSTGYSWDKSFCVYIFDVEQNILKQRITGLTYGIRDIEFSPDGKFVVAALSNEGIRIYETSSWTLVKSFTDYADDCSNIAFDNSGRFATVCDDGKVRLYSNNFELIKEKETDPGKNPFSLAFSPDGNLLAVGYNDSYQLQVFDGKNLKLQSEPDITDANNLEQRFCIVSFSHDGEFLIAGGTYNTDGNIVNYPVRVWSNKGKGKSFDLPGGKKTLIDIKPMSDNSVVFASVSPDLSRLKIDGTIQFTNSSELNIYGTSDKSHFKLNSNGTEVGITPFRLDALSYSITNRSLSVQSLQDGKSPVYTRNGVTVTDWNNSPSPKINGIATNFLQKGETCYSVDISDDASQIVFGTSWNIYCTDSSGKVLWSVSSNSAVWSINITDDNQTVVACFDNGTIQWYRKNPEFEMKVTKVLPNTVAERNGLLENDIVLSIDNIKFNSIDEYKSIVQQKKTYQFKVLRNNNEKILTVNKTEDLFGFQYSYLKHNLLLTLYTHPDNRRWVLWNPDGYFDCSEGADRLIGWHVNQGASKEALYYPASQFFEQYYTPNLGLRVLSGETVNNANISMNSFALPPLVRIVSPSTSTTVNNDQLNVTVQVTDQGGGIDEVRLYHNGKLLDATQRGFKAIGKDQTYTVQLTNGENHIKVTAFNTQRTEAIPDEVVVNYKAIQQAKPNMYILAVGINSYLNPKYNLNYAKNDADAFVKSLSESASTLFGKVEKITLNDANATREGILQAINSIKAKATPDDVFVFYYAGHGVMSTGSETDKSQFFLVPHNVTKMYEADEQLKKLGISANEIGDFSKNIKAQKQLFVIDACQSGGAMQTLAMRGAAEEKAIAQLARSTGTYFIAASGSEQFATEVAELGHGVFTYSVIKALSGDCKSQDGKVTVNLLKSCVEDLVPELSKKYKGQPQFPTGYGFGQDFPIGIAK
ncbi:hypothetical protein CYCD_24570 [Tenuifilaceae bacterium CYCD]|nr:hypothetical protein CYCD_24570 [Tenuifilaceae bacterium CYCD]